MRTLVYEGYMFLPSRDHAGQYLPVIFSHEIFHHLAFADLPESHHGRLLPNLRTLSWHSITIDTLPQVLTFVKPGLCDANLGFSALQSTPNPVDLSPFERVAGRMRRVPGLAPRKLRVHISCQPAQLWQSREVSDWLEQLNDVEDLYLEGIGLPSLYTTLGRLHLLRKLSLTLFWTSMEDASRILSTVGESSPLMERLMVTLEVKSSEEDAWLEPVTPFSTILPLTQIPKLRVLQLEFPSPIHLEPDDIAVMGTAWPRMRELVLSYRPYSAVGHSQSTKFSSLTAFAKAFGPNLRTLKHCFLVDDTMPDAGDKHFSRITLDVGTSPLEVERAPDVVPFLKTLFPHGVDLRSGAKPLPPRHDDVPLAGWQKVSELLVADVGHDGVESLAQRLQAEMDVGV